MTDEAAAAFLKRAFRMPAGDQLSPKAAARCVVETEVQQTWTGLRPATGSEEARQYRLQAQPMCNDNDACAVLLSLSILQNESASFYPPNSLETAFSNHLLGRPGLFVHRFLPDTTETFVGRAYARLLDASPSDLIGCQWIQHIAPERREDYLNRLQSLTRDQPTATFEQTFDDRGGRTRCIRWHVRAFFTDEHDTPAIFQSVGFDCTEQQNIKEQLFASQEWMRRLLENAQPVVFAFDTDGTFILSEGEQLRSLGLSPGEVVGLSIYDVFSDRSDIVDLVETALSGQRVEDQVTVNNHIFNVWYTPFNDAYGKVAGVLGMAVDITDRVEAETSLEKSEATYRNLINKASDAIYIQTPTGHILDVNEAAAALYGCEREDLIGSLPADLAAPGRNDMEYVHNIAAKAMDGHPQTFEFWGQRADGSHFLKEIRIQRGTYFGLDVMIAFARDITDRKQREEELIAARNTAEAANRMKSTMLANMSHEFRTPLTAIIGFAEVLMKEGPIEQRQRFAQHIYGNSQRLLRTLNAVLRFSELEAGDVSLQPAPGDLVAIVDDALAPFRPNLEEQAIAFRCEMPAQVHGIWDQRLVRQMLSYIIDNAISFTPDDGTITLRLDALPETARITVVDTGCGMAPSFIEKARHAFAQESSGRDRQHEGTGLGLAIVDRLVTVCDGTLDIESRKGEGTTVTVHLPYEPTTQADSPPVSTNRMLPPALSRRNYPESA